MQWISIEKWNHFHRQIQSISDDEHVCSVVPPATVICLDDSAVQSISNCFENVPARNILAHVEFRDSLPPDSHIRISLEGNVKAALSIDKSRDVMIFQDFDLSC
jgi:hypothetical protein